MVVNVIANVLSNTFFVVNKPFKVLACLLGKLQFCVKAMGPSV